MSDFHMQGIYITTLQVLLFIRPDLSQGSWWVSTNNRTMFIFMPTTCTLWSFRDGKSVDDEYEENQHVHIITPWLHLRQNSKLKTFQNLRRAIKIAAWCETKLETENNTYIQTLFQGSFNAHLHIYERCPSPPSLFQCFLSIVTIFISNLSVEFDKSFKFYNVLNFSFCHVARIIKGSMPML